VGGVEVNEMALQPVAGWRCGDSLPAVTDKGF